MLPADLPASFLKFSRLQILVFLTPRAPLQKYSPDSSRYVVSVESAVEFTTTAEQNKVDLQMYIQYIQLYIDIDI